MKVQTYTTGSAMQLRVKGETPEELSFLELLKTFPVNKPWFNSGIGALIFEFDCTPKPPKKIK